MRKHELLLSKLFALLMTIQDTDTSKEAWKIIDDITKKEQEDTTNVET